jgi:hypothetical protein
MQPGDTVQVTNLDGETTTGEIITVTEDTLSDTNAAWWEDDRNLWDYWRGTGDVSPDDQVVEVMLETGIYDYPETRVEVLEDA